MSAKDCMDWCHAEVALMFPREFFLFIKYFGKMDDKKMKLIPVSLNHPEC